MGLWQPMFSHHPSIHARILPIRVEKKCAKSSCHRESVCGKVFISHFRGKFCLSATRSKLSQFPASLAATRAPGHGTFRESVHRLRAAYVARRGLRESARSHGTVPEQSRVSARLQPRCFRFPELCSCLRWWRLEARIRGGSGVISFRRLCIFSASLIRLVSSFLSCSCT